VPWEHYVLLCDTLDVPGLRLTYSDGELELMTVGRTHEVRKSMIARLVETYVFLRDLPLNAYGSPTTRKKAKRGGFEPDESYTVGRTLDCDVDVDAVVDDPDIVLEVIVSNPLLNKLTLFAKFGIGEVWSIAAASSRSTGSPEIATRRRSGAASCRISTSACSRASPRCPTSRRRCGSSGCCSAGSS
jgi:Uma2 family endonuclease